MTGKLSLLIFAVRIENMIKQFILLFLLAGIFLGSCSHSKNQDSALISGLAPELAGEWVYLEELEVKRLVMIDSVKADEQGIFRFNLKLSEPGFFILRTLPENRITLLIDVNEKVEINCKNKLFNVGGKVSGSPGSKLLFDFEEFILNQKHKIDSLAEVFYAYEGTPEFLKKKFELDSSYSVILEDQRRYVMDFIDNNRGSLATLLVLNRKLGNSRVMDEEEDFTYFHRVDSALSILYPGNKHVVDHHNRVEEIRGRKFDRFTADEKLKPGKRAPNIVLRDTSNQPIALKSLINKKVLICFWAGWNAKSRQDNRKLVKLYPDFRKNNIEVFGVSFDENEIVWKGAVKLDCLPGIQGSDLKGLNSEVMKDYNLNDKLPFYCIIDKEQMIIYRDSNFGKIIEQLKLIFN
jgi:peroxiredoxin